MLKVRSHCSRVLVNRLPPPPMPALLNKQMDLVGRLLLDQLIAKTLEMSLDRDVGDMRGDAKALRQLFRLAQPLGLGHRLQGNVAHRDIAAFGHELAREFAAHARAASGDHGKLSGKVLH